MTFDLFVWFSGPGQRLLDDVRARAQSGGRGESGGKWAWPPRRELGCMGSRGGLKNEKRI